MKKAIKVTLILSMLLLILAGCGKTSFPEEEVLKNTLLGETIAVDGIELSIKSIDEFKEFLIMEQIEDEATDTVTTTVFATISTDYFEVEGQYIFEHKLIEKEYRNIQKGPLEFSLKKVNVEPVFEEIQEEVKNEIDRQGAETIEIGLVNMIDTSSLTDKEVYVEVTKIGDYWQVTENIGMALSFEKDMGTYRWVVQNIDIEDSEEVIIKGVDEELLKKAITGKYLNKIYSVNRKGNVSDFSYSIDDIGEFEDVTVDSMEESFENRKASVVATVSLVKDSLSVTGPIEFQFEARENIRHWSGEGDVNTSPWYLISFEVVGEFEHAVLHEFDLTEDDIWEDFELMTVVNSRTASYYYEYNESDLEYLKIRDIFYSDYGTTAYVYIDLALNGMVNSGSEFWGYKEGHFGVVSDEIVETWYGKAYNLEYEYKNGEWQPSDEKIYVNELTEEEVNTLKGIN